MQHHHIYADNATDHAPGSHPAIDCDGTEIWRTYGTWKGHVGPGTTFLVWGAWWTVWALWTYLRRGPARFQSISWYGPSLRGRRLPLEPFLKVFGPALIANIELYGDHAEFRTLICGEGPQRGRFAMTHMNNWQHASVYPGFLLAGALDWVAMVVPLPPGMQQAALAFAFFIEGFLMANHRKHEPLDQTVHSLLVFAIYGTAASIATELWRPRSVLPALGRGFCTLLQGAWLVQIARIMWGEDPRWALDYSGSGMMPPVYFVWIAVTAAACICACYVVLYMAAQRLGRSRYSLLPVSQVADGAGDAQPDPAFSEDKAVGKAAASPAASAAADICNEDGVLSREASKLLAAAECGAGSRGASFTAGLRQQGSMHMRSDSANDDSNLGSPAGSDHGSPRAGQGGHFGIPPSSIASQQDW